MQLSAINNGITLADETTAQAGQEMPPFFQLLKQLAAAFNIAAATLEQARDADLQPNVDFYEEVRRFEVRLIRRALERTNGNQSQAAKLLKLNQTTLHGKIKQYGISPQPLFYGVYGSRASQDLADTAASEG
jgi:DNA-binding NtrC family response regulator